MLFRSRSFTASRGETIIRHTGDPSQAIVRLVWPTRDDADPVESMQFETLERVVRLELTDGIREKLGKSYSPSATSGLSRTYPGYGEFTVTASVNVTDLAATRAAIAQIIADLRDKPVSADELARALAPLAEENANLLKTNAGWMNLVDRAQSQADLIARYAQFQARLKAVTARDVQMLARRYLVPGRAVELIVLPKGAAKP